MPERDARHHADDQHPDAPHGQSVAARRGRDLRQPDGQGAQDKADGDPGVADVQDPEDRFFERMLAAPGELARPDSQPGDEGDHGVQGLLRPVELQYNLGDYYLLYDLFDLRDLAKPVGAGGVAGEYREDTPADDKDDKNHHC